MTQRAEDKLAVYNRTKQSFLALTASVADTHLARLVGLLGRKKLRNTEGLWVVPCQGIHTVGLLFPIDVIYLDRDQQVIHVIEHLGPFRFAPVRMDCASVLELPVRSIYSSQTQVGDQLLICTAAEMQESLRSLREPGPMAVRPAASPAASAGAPAAAEAGTAEATALPKLAAFTPASAAPSNGAAAPAAEAPVITPPRRPGWGSSIVACYWTGGVAREHEVRALNASGARLVTSDRWYPGTVVSMFLQYEGGVRQNGHGSTEPMSSIAVRAKVVRPCEDGVEVSFVFFNREERRALELFLSKAPARQEVC